MFFGFKMESDIPENDLYCDCCGNALIIYTEHYDEYFDFDGKAGEVDKILEEINEERDL